MRHLCTLLVAATVLFSVRFASAETVYLKNGTVREGTIIEKTPDTIKLRGERDGMKFTQVIAVTDIDRIEKSKPAVATTAPKSTTAPAGPTASTSTAPAGTQTASAPSTRPKIVIGSPLPTGNFIEELASSAIGMGPDNPDRLPKDLRELWENAVKADKGGNSVTTLEALDALEDAFHSQAHGIERLDGITKRERQQSFGLWLATVHYDVMSTHLHGVQFDLRDVRDVEKAPLVGIMKEKTVAVLETLKPYFPPLDEKTGRYGPFQATQLSSISVTNAIEVKQQTGLATALLLAQRKLEPDMPQADKALIGSQQTIIYRIASKAGELEPAARREADKVARDKQLADEKAKRDAEKLKPVAPPK